MAKFAFIYHGGSTPETPEEGQAVMAKWMSWLGGLDTVDQGNPFGMSSTVHPDGSVTNDGGSNPASGYSIVNADSQDQANEMAKGCPILEGGGHVEVCEIHEI